MNEIKKKKIRKRILSGCLRDRCLAIAAPNSTGPRLPLTRPLSFVLYPVPGRRSAG